MASALLPNTWYHRRVADSSAKSCDICYKPSTSVLITPDSKDFFYICPGHLKDRSFCTPDAVEADAVKARKEKEELDREIEKVKAEYEEKKKRREKRRADRKKEKEKEKEKDKNKDKDETKKEDDEEKKDEEDRDAKIKSLQNDESKVEDGPRIYSLHKTFYQKRLNRIRNAEMAKRNRERMKNPSLFPSVPSGNP